MGLDALLPDWRKACRHLPVETCHGSAVVACGAKCVWDDLQEVPNLDHDTMVVNDIGLRYPGTIRHWYSSHADAFTGYTRLRGHRCPWTGGEAGPELTHTIAASSRPDAADCVWPWPGHGSSGLNAIYTAIALGYQKIYVCGMPLDNSGHFNDGPPGHWLETRTEKGKWSWYADIKHHRPYERAISDVFDGKVTFMSGRFA